MKFLEALELDSSPVELQRFEQVSPWINGWPFKTGEGLYLFIGVLRRFNDTRVVLSGDTCHNLIGGTLSLVLLGTSGIIWFIKYFNCRQHMTIFNWIACVTLN